eukprot:TRINITY_DN90377_c0_g1_i1.p1 TRINITY_DN90377_c0_g1~~TRINITY_DN90377_c0_g1_i1.p1  ORF type:complete len:253 (+),score=39.19 TRINITY_DN90377_c0_g1_i1:37-759(+)
MPVELWLQCACPDARPGEHVKVVGSDPALGCWDPRRSKVLLETSASEFPVWRPKEPFLLECPEKITEYKYVVVSAEGSRWEELSVGFSQDSRLELSDIGFGAECKGDSTSSDFQPEDFSHEPCSGNRRLEIHGDCVVFRSETFGLLEAPRSGCWPVCPDWAPGVAGGGAVVGIGKHRTSQNPIFRLQFRLPLQLFVEHRRGRLLATVAQLSKAKDLPPGLWPLILGFIGIRQQSDQGQSF